MPTSTVHIVHCIDTEGPLYESLDATFERLRSIFGLDLTTDAETLSQLQNREIDLDGMEDEVARVVSPELLDYNETWADIDAMLEEIMSPEFRNAATDSFGNGWVFNWHCLDIVGFEDNPRRRDTGFHKVFDHYQDALAGNGNDRDAIHFHHHPVPFSRSAHHPATHFFNHAPVIYEILAHRIIDRQWFPCVNRPGFHATRPDSHWFLEQFIPFDYANQSTQDTPKTQRDVSGGRFGDWRRAPRTWAPYHPSYDDYQKPGNSRRWVARCLNIGTRLRLLDAKDVDQAFREAEEGKPVVMAFANHDYRDMKNDINRVRAMIAETSKRYPDVPYKFCEGREAMRDAFAMDVKPAFELEMSFTGNCLNIRAERPIFGPQPFLAIQTKDGRYLHDNLDFGVPFEAWSYVFDEYTVPHDELASVGVAACDAAGNVTVTVFDMSAGFSTERHL